MACSTQTLDGSAQTGYSARVITHLDVAGKSGATYRFRLAKPGDLPAHSGNYLLVRSTRGQQEVIACGMALSLALIADHVNGADGDASTIFVRLNVSRETREHEHADIAAQLPMGVVVTNFG